MPTDLQHPEVLKVFPPVQQPSIAKCCDLNWAGAPKEFEESQSAELDPSHRGKASICEIRQGSAVALSATEKVNSRSGHGGHPAEHTMECRTQNFHWI